MPTPKTLSYLRQIATVGAIGAVIGVVYSLLAITPLSEVVVVAGELIGLCIATTLTMLELWILPRYRRLRFLSFLVLRALLFMLPIVCFNTFFVLLLIGQIEWATFLNSMGFSFLASVMVSFFFGLNRILGQQVLFSYFTGRYHHPVLDWRVVMFLDLKGSTTIAEEIGDVRFHRLLNDLFHDIPGAVISWGGEINKYMGDGAIITWPRGEGAGAIGCFLDLLDVMAQRQGYYLRHYGLKPEWRAGVHAGEVVVGEMGDLKQEIAILGDVVNTASRIQKLCSELGVQLLVSETALEGVEHAQLPPFREFAPLALRGKSHPLRLFALSI